MNTYTIICGASLVWSGEPKDWTEVCKFVRDSPNSFRFRNAKIYRWYDDDLRYVSAEPVLTALDNGVDVNEIPEPEII